MSAPMFAEMTPAAQGVALDFYEAGYVHGNAAGHTEGYEAGFRDGFFAGADHLRTQLDRLAEMIGWPDGKLLPPLDFLRQAAEEVAA